MKITVFVEMAPHMYEGGCKEAYPEGLDIFLQELFAQGNHEVKLITQKKDEDGSSILAQLEKTDVLVWWAHCYHHLVSDAVAVAVRQKVLDGMGFLALHSSHMAKPLLQLLGTDGTLCWREIDERERLWIIDPTHPIAKGLPSQIVIEHEEMYGEPFGIPAPDELIMIGWFRGGEVFRSGAVFKRGRGKIFYFQPGHESNPTYRLPEIQKLLLNAAEYIYNPAGIRKEPYSCQYTPDPYETN